MLTPSMILLASFWIMCVFTGLVVSVFLSLLLLNNLMMYQGLKIDIIGVMYKSEIKMKKASDKIAPKIKLEFQN